MRLDVRKHLYDIERACARLQEFTAGKTFSDYEGDALLRSAVERQFEIIGEALGRLARVAPETAESITEYQRIIAFRNVLIHGYDVVSDAVVWGIVERNLPVLASEVASLLAVPDDAG